MRNLKST